MMKDSKPSFFLNKSIQFCIRIWFNERVLVIILTFEFEKISTLLF